MKKALEVTHELGGEGYTFWGGREGYQTLWNTDMKRELDHLAQFLHMAVDYAKQDRLQGPVLHRAQAEGADQAPVRLRRRGLPQLPAQYDLLDHFKLNLETNHATLAGHTMQHELEVAGAAGALGSIDANTGDMLLGWDTDQFPTDIYLTTQCMFIDPQVRRLHHRRRELRRQGPPRELRADRPVPRPHRRHGRLRPRPQDRRCDAGRWQVGRTTQRTLCELGSGFGAEIESGKHSFASLEKIMLEKGDISGNRSGRQEMLENLINTYLSRSRVGIDRSAQRAHEFIFVVSASLVVIQLHCALICAAEGS